MGILYMFCSNCGYEIKAGVLYCPICGFPVPKQQRNKESDVVQMQPASGVQMNTQKHSPEPSVNAWNPMNERESSYAADRKQETSYQQSDNEGKLKHKSEIIILFSIVAALILVAVISIKFTSGNGSNAPQSPVASNTDSSSDNSGISADSSDAEDAGASDNTASADTADDKDVIKGTVNREVSHIFISEKDGILYNNQGLYNEKFKGRLSECIFNADHSMCAVIDNQDKLYIVKSDLTSEYISNANEAGFSMNGAYFYYIAEDCEANVVDLATFKSHVLTSAKYCLDLHFSSNGDYVAFAVSDHDSDEKKYIYKVVTNSGEEVLEFESNIYYVIEGLSNDGKVVYFQCHDLGENAVYYYKNGDIAKIDGSENARLTFDNGMENAILESDQTVSHFSADTGKTTEIISGENCSVITKNYNNNLLTATLFDETLKGCVINKDKDLFWLTDNFGLFPIAEQSKPTDCKFVCTENGRYRYLYEEDNKLHMVIYEKAGASDRVLFVSSAPIHAVAADSKYEDIWVSTEDKKIYHVDGSGEKELNFESGESLIDLVYDIYAERLLLLSDNQLFELKKDGSFGFIKKDVGRIRSRYPYESVVVCTDLDDEKYKVYGDIFAVVSDY